jgi:hypothetical protein
MKERKQEDERGKEGLSLGGTIRKCNRKVSNKQLGEKIL